MSLVTKKEFEPMDADGEQKIRDQLIRARVQMLIAFPFFGMLAMQLKWEVDYSIKTAATDGTKFYYNPYFIKTLTEEEKNWIVVHEVMHPALKHLWRRGNREPEKWNWACDYAIHSIMHQFTNGTDKSEHRSKLKMPGKGLYDPQYDNMSADQIYDLLPKDYKKQKGKGGQGGGGGSNDDDQGTLDDHSKWDKVETQADAQQKAQDWEGRLVEAAQVAENKRPGSVPGYMKRLIGNITSPQKDWRILLNEFIQPETDDYSFLPPDRRFQDNDFFLPDLNDTVEVVKKILFYIDTSGSIGEKELCAAYSEILGAINQFSGKLSGWIGFFDHIAYGLHSFESVTDVMKIKPEGGGGTSFHAPFEYINEHHKDDEIAGIIILTDGYADWPKESIANGVPTLWLINNEEVKSPWGLYTTIKIK
jgi:predicted metal-dependent peptidase